MNRVKTAVKGLRVALALCLAGCASAPLSPLEKQAALSVDKAGAFDAALLTLQEWDENILTVDKAGGILATRPKESAATGNIVLRYRLTVFVKEGEGGGILVEVNAHGEKHASEHDDWWSVDENDPDLRAVIEGVLGGIVEKAGGSPRP